MKFNTLLIATALVVLSELLLPKILDIFLLPILTILIVRMIQISILFFILKPDKLNIEQGFKAGLLWSVSFGILALILYPFLNFIEINPLKFLTITLPKQNFEIMLFLITASVISPIAEEIFFRGFIYTYFRKFNFVIALVLSTTFFALPHCQQNTFPFIPIIGGIVFALSFEYSKNLVTPIIIHISGNLTLFSLALFIDISSLNSLV